MMELTPSTMPFVFVNSKSWSVIFRVFTKSLKLMASLQSVFKNTCRLNCVLLVMLFVLLVIRLPMPPPAPARVSASVLSFAIFV